MTSRDRRAAAIAPSSPWRGLWPVPDGTIGAGDRVQTAFMYRGIVDGAAPAAAAAYIPTFRPRRRP